MSIKEIQAVENMIKMLDRCLAIHLKNLNHEHAISCLKDVEYCKQELYKLKSDLKAEKRIKENGLQ